MISLKNISIQRGAKELFSNVNLTFYARQKIGIIGKNGSGKTTLFSMLVGDLHPDHGEISITNNVRIAQIEQEIANSDKNVIEFVIDADTALCKIESELQIAAHNHDGMRQAELFLQYENRGGYSARARVASLLTGLGLTQVDQAKSVNELSGGLIRRLNLARTLFVPSDILLLDEPTNHLDLETVVWLEKYLAKYSGLVLLISHDRDFLDNIVTHIVQIEQKHLKLFTGNYSQFEQQNALDLELQQKGYISQQKQIAHLESFINRFRAKASKAKQAQSRIKLLEKMQLVEPVYQTGQFNFEFLPPHTVPHILVNLEDVTFAYEQQKIFHQVNFRLDAGMRIGLLGRNGVGKSTFIKLLLGELTPQHGRRQANHKLQVGYFAQYQLDNLDADSTPLASLQKIATNTTELDLRRFLGRFAFSGEMATQKIATFSGGERARLVLALIVWQRPNLLLLDEPTNHLDISMREALAYALQSYSGAMLIVSHDRHLLRAAVDDFYLINNKNIEHFTGDLDDYQEWLFKSENTPVISKSAVQTVTASSINKKISKNRLQKVESELNRLGNEAQEIEKQLLDVAIYQTENSAKLQQLITRQKAIKQLILQYEDEWLSTA